MIFFTDHAQEKLDIELEKFNITRESVTKTINQPDQILYDTQTNRYVAINHEEKTATIYEKTGENIHIITKIYSSTLKKVVENRRQSGRWI
jgi:hypothetical protein